MGFTFTWNECVLWCFWMEHSLSYIQMILLFLSLTFLQLYKWFIYYLYCILAFISEIFIFHNFLISSSSLSFSAQRSSFCISCKVGLVVLNSFSFCLSVKTLYFSFKWIIALLGRVSLVVVLFCFVFLLSFWIYHVAPTGLQSFCWKVRWLPNGSSLVFN